MSELFDLSKFDSYREDNRREVKKANAGLPTSLWDTYSAFANCYGGVIILGIKENKDGSWITTGLQDVTKLLKNFWDTINNRTKYTFQQHIESKNLYISTTTSLVEPSGETGRVIITAHEFK